MNPTKLLYLENFSQLISEAEVLQCSQENGKDIVILDQTVFYPQGGGQPYDKGAIEAEGSKFSVQEVRKIDTIVKHIGIGLLKTGERVKCSVNRERRDLNSRLHSAGHIIDMALLELNLTWIPGKGYHFPDGPYVEYQGSIGGLNKEKLISDIETLCMKYIGQALETKLMFVDEGRAKEICKLLPDYLHGQSNIRIVMYGSLGIPCGGTHVSNLLELKSMKIRKIKSEGPNIRIGYNIPV